MPLEVRDGRWHHICISWTTRDGQWEAYQDGEKRGTGDNLAAWHPIKPGGVIILGQEQVRKTLKYEKKLMIRLCLTHACVCCFSHHSRPFVMIRESSRLPGLPDYIISEFASIGSDIVFLLFSNTEQTVKNANNVPSTV